MLILVFRYFLPLLYRAGELSQDEIDKVVTIMAHPRQFRIPNWMLNRQKDVKDGKFSQVFANALDSKLRDDIERLKKIRAHRGLRHYWGLRVRGQHTKTTGKFFPRCFLCLDDILFSIYFRSL